jgi:hypothetical protein
MNPNRVTDDSGGGDRYDESNDEQGKEVSDGTTTT